MAESIQQVKQTIQSGDVQNIVALVEKFFQSPQFWQVHGAVLTINWFVVAFFAILIKAKYRGAASKFGHAFLMFLCNVSTLFVNFGGFYKVYPHLNTFATWPLLQQAHIASGAIFSVLLILIWLGGISSILGADSSGHKKLGRPIAFMGSLTAIFGMVLAKQQAKAGIFAIVFLIEVIILSKAAPKQIKQTKTSGSTSPRTSKRD